MGQFWTPILAKGGSLLHADLHITTNSTYRAHVQAKIETLKIERDVLVETLRRALKLTKLGVQEAEQKHNKRAAALLQEAVNEHPSYESYMNLGYILEEISEIDQAEAAYKEAAALAPKDPRPLKCLGMIRLYNNPVEAREPLERALRLWESGDRTDKELLLMIRGNLGCAFYDEANSLVSPDPGRKEKLLQEAYRYYSTALELSGFTKNRDFLARLRSNLGNVCVALQRYSEADPHFKVALTIKRELAADVSLAITENNYGELLLRNGHVEQAEKLFQNARNVFSLTGHKANEALVLVNLAEVEHVQGRTDQAKGLLRRAIELCNSSDATAYRAKIEAKLKELEHVH